MGDIVFKPNFNIDFSDVIMLINTVQFSDSYTNFTECLGIIYRSVWKENYLGTGHKVCERDQQKNKENRRGHENDQNFRFKVMNKKIIGHFLFCFLVILVREVG